MQHSPHQPHVTRKGADITSANAGGETGGSGSSFTPVTGSGSRLASLPTPPRPLSNHTPTIVPQSSGAHSQRSLNGPLAIASLERDKTPTAAPSPGANDASSAHKFASTSGDTLSDIATLVAQEASNVRPDSITLVCLYKVFNLLYF